MKTIPVALAAGLAAALAAASGAAGPPGIDSGVIVVGRGIHGVTLGMTRSQVVARLGRPIYENRNGYMQYSRRFLFDVYSRRGNPRRVDLVSASGPGFCLSGEICVDPRAREGVPMLARRYGARLRAELTAEDPAEPLLVVRKRFHGRRTNTGFSTSRNALLQVFIAYSSSDEPAFQGTGTPQPLSVTAEVRTDLRTAFCRDIAGTAACTDPLFRGPLSGRQCLRLEPGGRTYCDRYRLCRLSFAGSEWAQASFWLAHTGAMGTTTWFRRPAGGSWRGFRELIVPRRLAAAFAARC